MTDLREARSRRLREEIVPLRLRTLQEARETLLKVAVGANALLLTIEKLSQEGWEGEGVKRSVGGGGREGNRSAGLPTALDALRNR